MPSFWRQAIELARKDLRTEVRSGEVLMITVPFGAAALMLIPTNRIGTILFLRSFRKDADRFNSLELVNGFGWMRTPTAEELTR